MLIFWVHILFLVPTRTGLHVLMLKKLICFLVQPTAAALFFPGFLPLSEMLCFSYCPASEGLLCCDWPVQTHTFQMNQYWSPAHCDRGLRFEKTDGNGAFVFIRNRPQGLLLHTLNSLFHTLVSFKTAVRLCNIIYRFKETDKHNMTPLRRKIIKPKP